MSGTSLLIMTTADQLYCIDFQTGQTKWVYEAGTPSDLIVANASAPLVRDSKAYVGTSGGELHAVDLSSGKMLWSHNPSYTDFRFHDVVGDLFISAASMAIFTASRPQTAASFGEPISANQSAL